MRTVREWVGRTDDSKPSDKCKQRIVERQGRRCALSGREFVPGDRIEYDHVVPLWLGGKNVESNLQAVLGEKHKAKTKAEAGVRAKVNANAAKHLGITKPAGKLQGRGFARSEKARPAKDSMPPRELFRKPIPLWAAGNGED